jgi:outer membrane protein assembly factor BamB
VPVAWAADRNVAWVSDVPGRGHSSPTVVGDVVVMLTADEQAQVQSVLAFDRATGRSVWQRPINTGGFPEKIHRKNTHASSTVASDGHRLYAVSFHHDGIHVTTLDMAGKVVWSKQIGPFRPRQYRNGYAASPTLHAGLLVVLAECDDSSYLVGMDAVTGQEKWRTKRPSRISYSSPTIAHVGGKHQILISGCDRVAGFDPLTGKQLWFARETTMAMSGTMVWHQNLVFASGGFPDAGTVCLRADGSNAVVWKNTQKCYEQSMLVHNGYLYAMNDLGIVFCWNATDGREMWKRRLQGPVSASPVLAGDAIYISNERGTTFVFRADPQAYHEIGRNQLGDEAFATPSPAGGRLYMRVAFQDGDQRRERLFAIGK